MLIADMLEAKGRLVFTIEPTALIAHAVRHLAEHDVGALVVSRDRREVLGLISERDVVRAIARRGRGVLEEDVSTVMTRDVHRTSASGHVEEVMAIMTTSRVRHVTVTDDSDHLLGIVSIGDAVKSRLDDLEGERTALIGYITSGR